MDSAASTKEWEMALKCAEWSYRSTALKGSEFAFTVDLSSLPCGFNAALYFVGMTENRGAAEAGEGYCDAQAVGGTFW